MIATLIASAVVAYGIDTSGVGRHIAFGPTVSGYAMVDARGEPFGGSALGLEAIFFQFDRRYGAGCEQYNARLRRNERLSDAERAAGNAACHTVISEKATMSLKLGAELELAFRTENRISTRLAAGVRLIDNLGVAVVGGVTFAAPADALAVGARFGLELTWHARVELGGKWPRPVNAAKRPAFVFEPFLRAEAAPFLRDIFGDQLSLGVRVLFAP